MVRDGHAASVCNGAVLASLPLGPQDVQSARRRLGRISGPCRLGIVARQCTVTLSKIVLERDVYYRSLDEMPGSTPANESGSTNHPVTLDAQSYYLLGDNSLRSLDSRQLKPISARAIHGVAGNSLAGQPLAQPLP